MSPLSYFKRSSIRPCSYLTLFIPSGFPFPLWNCRDRKPIYLGNENQDRFFHTVFAMNKYLVSVSLRSMAVLLLPPQSPRGLSALARLYYFARPTKTALLRRLGECRLRTLSHHFCHSEGHSIHYIFHLFKCKVISRLKLSQSPSLLISGSGSWHKRSLVRFCRGKHKKSTLRASRS